MTRSIRLFVCLIAALVPLPVFAQVAYVYVPTPKGIYAYAASSAGKLTVIKGSPFTQSNLALESAVGSNGSHFITTGAEDVHSYAVSSDGVIGAQVEQIDTQKYTGVACGLTMNTTNSRGGTSFDRTGKYLYVMLNSNPIGCNAIQTFEIASNGGLTFKGASVFDVNTDYGGNETITVFSGNNKFAYDSDFNPPVTDCLFYFINTFSRESSGALQLIDATVTGPTPQPHTGNFYGPWAISADSTNHLAVALVPIQGSEYGFCSSSTFPVQLASYTIASDGNLTSTNTWANMPTLSSYVNLMAMSPAGNILAVSTGTGVQFFHFNGAKPITEFTGILGTSGYISQMSWDTSNHLYAVNGQSGKLHVYDVTTTSAKEAAESPYVIPGGATNVLVFSR